jgi:hypothetical protein
LNMAALDTTATVVWAHVIALPPNRSRRQTSRHAAARGAAPMTECAGHPDEARATPLLRVGLASAVR